MSKRLPAVENCLNCGTRVSDRYCARCGQESVNQSVSIYSLLGEFLDQIFNFDSKLFRTLGLLLFRPGKLTVSYNSGQRVRYFAPVRIYLLTSVAFFLLASWKASQVKIPDMIVNTNTSGKNVNSNFGSKKQGAKGNEAVISTEKTLNPLDEIPKTMEEWEKKETGSKKMNSTERFYVGQIIKIRQYGISGLLQRFQGYIPNTMLFLLPLFALALKILYLRSGKKYVEHVIFLLHCHSFLYLVLLLFLAIQIPLPFTLMMPLLCVYYYMAMRRVYGQSFLKMSLKFAMLSSFYVIVLSITTVITSYITLILL